MEDNVRRIQTKVFRRNGVEKLGQKRYLLLLLIPAAATAFLCAIFGSFIMNLSGAEVVQFLSDNPVFAAIELLGLYFLKTCSIIFPQGALQIASGTLYPLPIALGVNLMGLIITVSVPFLLGKKTTPELQRSLIRRFPRLQSIENVQNRNPFTYCFLLRLICVVPGDLLSWYLGTTGLGYLPFLLGTVLGKLTGMILFTLLGANLTARSSWRFWFLWVALVVLNYLLVKGIERYAASKVTLEREEQKDNL